MAKKEGGLYEEDAEVKNINYYVDIGSTLHSWILPVGGLEIVGGIDKGVKINLNDGKARDVDMGFMNNGLH